MRLLFLQRRLILSLARRDVAAEYVGSLLGFIWKLINPLMLIAIFWVVFSLGLRIQPQNNVPFVVWFSAGMAAWFLFSDIVSGSIWLVVSNANLIKKSVFPSQILPVTKIVACLIAHGVFVAVLVCLIVTMGMPFSFYYFQFAYYLVYLVLLALGIGWAVAALNVFIRDVGQIVAVLLQVGFWATPIVWDLPMLPPALQAVLKLNPVYYVVRGYRESFIYFYPAWRHPFYETLYFWSVAAVVFMGGALIFKKLKPQFADVL